MNWRQIWPIGAVVIAVCVFFFGSGKFGSKVVDGKTEVFYLDGATKEQAEKLAAYMTKEMPTNDRRSVQIRKKDDAIQYRNVIKKEFQNDETTLRALEIAAARISRDVFDGQPVEVDVCDEHLVTVRNLPPRADIRYGVIDQKIEVFYATPAEKEDAIRLAKHFAEIVKDGRLISFKVVRRDPKTVEVHMVTQKEQINDPSITPGLQADIRVLSQQVFDNSAVEFHLTDESFKVVRVVKDGSTK